MPRRHRPSVQPERHPGPTARPANTRRALTRCSDRFVSASDELEARVLRSPHGLVHLLDRVVDRPWAGPFSRAATATAIPTAAETVRRSSTGSSSAAPGQCVGQPCDGVGGRDDHRVAIRWALPGQHPTGPGGAAVHRDVHGDPGTIGPGSGAGTRGGQAGRGAGGRRHHPGQDLQRAEPPDPGAAQPGRPAPGPGRVRVAAGRPAHAALHLRARPSRAGPPVRASRRGPACHARGPAGAGPRPATATGQRRGRSPPRPHNPSMV
jgi:hypothetical protein